MIIFKEGLQELQSLLKWSQHQLRAASHHRDKRTGAKQNKYKAIVSMGTVWFVLRGVKKGAGYFLQS